MARDNGGAIAQKGFNYQTAVISFVAIRNYKKSNFEIYVEADEDFEVLYDSQYHAYIQVKGHKTVSLKKLLNSNKGTSSIIEKNLRSGTDKDTYKIIVYQFSANDLKKMEEAEDELFGRKYIFSEDQKQEINNPRSDNLSLVITDFKTDLESANRFLVGEMNSQGISVDNKATLILSELSSLIAQKSEIIVEEDSDKILKRISATELEPILQKVSALELFETILKKFGFSEIKNKKILIEKNRLILEHSYLRKEAKEIILEQDADNMSEVELINKVIKSDNLRSIEGNVAYAICISAYCDIVEGLSYE